jgi:hypothetical protein
LPDAYYLTSESMALLHALSSIFSLLLREKFAMAELST